MTRVVPVPEFLAARARGDRATERAFFSCLLLRNGVYKTTEEHRMDDLLPGLVAQARSLASLRVLDVACSSGVTTVELHRAFEAAGLAPRTTGTDLTLEAEHVARGSEAILFDSRGEVLQVELGSWATPWRPRLSDRVFHPLRSARARALGGRAAEFRRGGEVTKVALLAGTALAAPGLTFVEEDVLAPRVPGLFDFVRVANLLNPGYFDEATLARMVSAVASRVAPGGLLLVLRSVGSPPAHHGTLFRQTETGFAEVERYGAGSEIAGLVLAAEIPYNQADHAFRS